MQALMSCPSARPDPTAVRRPVAGYRSKRLTLTKQEFEAWHRQAAPGDRVVYHRGYLAVDRVRNSGGLSEQDRRELLAVAKAALVLAEQDEIHLLQRRLEPGSYSYIAVKSHRNPGSR